MKGCLVLLEIDLQGAEIFEINLIKI